MLAVKEGRDDLAKQALESMTAIQPRPSDLTEERLGQLRELIERGAGQGEGRS